MRLRCCQQHDTAGRRRRGDHAAGEDRAPRPGAPLQGRSRGAAGRRNLHAAPEPAVKLLENGSSAKGDSTMRITLYLMALLSLAGAAQAQDPAANTGRRPGGGGPITLNPDDVQAYPEPPAGINAERSEVPH